MLLEIVLYARELTSVYICHSKGSGFNTPLSVFYTQSVVCPLSGTTVMLGYVP